MICIRCKENFEVVKGHGGSNRLLCYECLPANLSKQQRDKLRRKQLRIASEIMKEDIGCAKCGYSLCSAAMDWHHIDSGSKVLDPSVAVQRSWNTYLEEIKKCILLCSNCHREFHHREKEEGISITDFL